jgi:hypothetical protein
MASLQGLIFICRYMLQYLLVVVVMAARVNQDKLDKD